jgi:predicted nucleic-acid-binding protein
MRALDTNVLVRFVTNDDAGQAAVAERLFAECQRNRERLFISTIVICELFWVLKNGLRQTKVEIVKVIDGLVEDDLFQIEQRALVVKGLEHYRHGRADFADYLIGLLGGHAGCRDTVTFDRALKGSPGFTLL